MSRADVVDNAGLLVSALGIEIVDERGVSQRYACLPLRPVVAVGAPGRGCAISPTGLPVERWGTAH